MIGFVISEQEFEQLSKEGKIVDARRGGLVVGRSHDEGNIYILKHCDEGYRVINHMEGGEYVICHEALVTHKDRIISINNKQMKCKFVDIDVLRHTPLLITAQKGGIDKFLLMDDRGQFVVNKGSTCYFLDDLNWMNEHY